MSTMSTSILPGCSTSKASRNALAEARCPPPVSDIKIWIVHTSSSLLAVTEEYKELLDARRCCWTRKGEGLRLDVVDTVKECTA
mmetsp:Transcript_2588/g.3598  ORF Transcript_2588/g.3598 Transcript_2588/m.3598 type:complete len:84 (-) Transcript_2588:314-565(-)